MWCMQRCWTKAGAGKKLVLVKSCDGIIYIYIYVKAGFMIFEGIGYIDIGSATVEVHVIVILSYVATVR